MELRLAQLEQNNQPWKKSLKLGQNSAYLTHWQNGRIIMEYLLCPNNHLFVAYAAPKNIAENSDFIRLLGQKPKLANIFAGFLAYYLRRAKKLPCDRNRKSYQTLDLGMNLCSCAQGVTVKPFGIIRRAVKSPCPGILTAISIYCPQQIRAMDACFGLTQGELESEYNTCTPFLSSLSFLLFLFSI